jgi:hypothetical protein
MSICNCPPYKKAETEIIELQRLIPESSLRRTESQARLFDQLRRIVLYVSHCLAHFPIGRFVCIEGSPIGGQSASGLSQRISGTFFKSLKEARDIL